MPTSRRLVDSSGEDFYPTPEWATQALLSVETFEGLTWEPACGNGAMTEILNKNCLTTISSDIVDRGYKYGGVADFLIEGKTRRCANVITNPPYNLAEDFVHRGLEVVSNKLALLLRLSFLESVRRFDSIYTYTPPSRVWVFSERITFYPNGLQTAGTGTLAYAWFVWEKPLTGTCELKWLPPRLNADRSVTHRFTDEEFDL